MICVEVNINLKEGDVTVKAAEISFAVTLCKYFYVHLLFMIHPHPDLYSFVYIAHRANSCCKISFSICD